LEHRRRLNMNSIKKMQKGGAAPFDIQVAFNILAILLAVQIYDNFLKDTIGKGKTIDELVGLK
jgi:hypothetical protein